MSQGNAPVRQTPSKGVVDFAALYQLKRTASSSLRMETEWRASMLESQRNNVCLKKNKDLAGTYQMKPNVRSSPTLKVHTRLSLGNLTIIVDTKQDQEIDLARTWEYNRTVHRARAL